MELEFLDEVGGEYRRERIAGSAQKYVTLVTVDERGREERYYLPPFLAALYLVEVIPFLVDEPRVVRAKILWGGDTRRWTY